MLRLILGPFNAHFTPIEMAGAVVAIVALTLLTQVGGLVLWFTLGIDAIISRRRYNARKLSMLAIFTILYGFSTVIIVPTAAPLFGRVALNCFADGQHPYEANSFAYCALNRHYVAPVTKQVLEQVSNQMARTHPGTLVSYLDAGFPFDLGIPLLPHLSHKDGRKLDLAFFYKSRPTGVSISKGGAWFIGYWAFAPAWNLLRSEPVSPNDGFLRWRFDWLQWSFADSELDQMRTGDLIRILSQGPISDRVQKIFLEPYLAKHLNVQNSKIRFAGWNAARHDDHLHFQVY
ncbi:hypothetical protein [Pelagibius sp. Alg239-R121]|uniref:hypothetical protein n=1 Tax=Pelagibius sp. Alg239-R121 TaxID=2993448 RepID=UPI0024A67111|nr:hypothetical protein [Pelagibius sp. Alg239-R121]